MMIVMMHHIQGKGRGGRPSQYSFVDYLLSLSRMKNLVSLNFCCCLSSSLCLPFSSVWLYYLVLSISNVCLGVWCVVLVCISSLMLLDDSFDVLLFYSLLS